jgi:hypothetical protein
MARYVIPTSDPSARTGERSDASTNVQPPTQERQQTLRGAGDHGDPILPRDGATLAAVAERLPAPPPPAPLPREYRGKSSGEFQRVTSDPGIAPDANSLIAEAERHLVTLPPSDRNRRLLEVAILRRDTALLGGLLEVFRRQSR